MYCGCEICLCIVFSIFSTVQNLCNVTLVSRVLASVHRSTRKTLQVIVVSLASYTCEYSTREYKYSGVPILTLASTRSYTREHHVLHSRASSHQFLYSVLQVVTTSLFGYKDTGAYSASCVQYTSITSNVIIIDDILVYKVIHNRGVN